MGCLRLECLLNFSFGVGWLLRSLEIVCLFIYLVSCKIAEKNNLLKWGTSVSTASFSEVTGGLLRELMDSKPCRSACVAPSLSSEFMGWGRFMSRKLMSQRGKCHQKDLNQEIWTKWGRNMGKQPSLPRGVGEEGGEDAGKPWELSWRKGLALPSVNSEFTGLPIDVSGHLRISLNNSSHCSVSV